MTRRMQRAGKRHLVLWYSRDESSHGRTTPQCNYAVRAYWIGLSYAQVDRRLCGKAYQVMSAMARTAYVLAVTAPSAYGQLGHASSEADATQTFSWPDNSVSHARPSTRRSGARKLRRHGTEKNRGPLNVNRTKFGRCERFLAGTLPLSLGVRLGSGVLQSSRSEAAEAVSLYTAAAVSRPALPDEAGRSTASVPCSPGHERCAVLANMFIYGEYDCVTSLGLRDVKLIVDLAPTSAFRSVSGCTATRRARDRR